MTDWIFLSCYCTTYQSTEKPPRNYPCTLVGWNLCQKCSSVFPQSTVETYNHGINMVLPWRYLSSGCSGNVERPKPDTVDIKIKIPIYLRNSPKEATFILHFWLFLFISNRTRWSRRSLGNNIKNIDTTETPSRLREDISLRLELTFVIVQSWAMINSHLPPLLTDCFCGYCASGFGYIFLALACHNCQCQGLSSKPWRFIQYPHEHEKKSDISSPGFKG